MNQTIAASRVAVKLAFQYAWHHVGDTQQQSKLSVALARIDSVNAADPRGYELEYARRLSAWVERLCPSASEPLQLAARAQHIGRWLSPRESYPPGRSGYLKWRTDLKQLHAQKTGEILHEVGCDDPTVTRVQDLIQKRNFPRDTEACVLEDALCLLFLETQFTTTTAKTGAEKMVVILQKTWQKMTPQAHQLALTLPLPADCLALVKRALQESK